MKFLKELSLKLNRSEEELLLIGLICTDFTNKVSFSLDDGTKMELPRAFSVERDEEIGVFTEHYSYFVIDKDAVLFFEEESLD